MARSGVRPQPRRWALALLLLARPCVSHWHEEWEAGQTYSYPWYEQPWVGRVNTFYCDEDCAARLEVAPTVDREFKALVELLNQTTGGPRNPYRGAFEGLDEYVEGQLNGAELSRRAASLATWKHMEGWDSILTAHTSALTLCTELKLDGNESFTRQLCYDKIFASDGGPIFPSPRSAPPVAAPLSVGRPSAPRRHMCHLTSPMSALTPPIPSRTARLPPSLPLRCICIGTPGAPADGCIGALAHGCIGTWVHAYIVPKGACMRAGGPSSRTAASSTIAPSVMARTLSSGPMRTKR